jgi:hypothetical protein
MLNAADHRARHDIETARCGDLLDVGPTDGVFKPGAPFGEGGTLELRDLAALAEVYHQRGGVLGEAEDSGDLAGTEEGAAIAVEGEPPDGTPEGRVGGVHCG